MKYIALINGPYNGTRIKDSGAFVIKMCVATSWQDGMPAVGSQVGKAIYEPSESRAQAFWLENQWDGICETVGPF